LTPYLDNDRVFISGDTQFDHPLIDLYADQSEVMFHDVQFFPGAVHAPLADLKTLPPAIQAKMYLMHYADNWQEQDIDGFAGWAQQGVSYIFD
jgi:ribonuclease BN (tRNA processing enzyme)